MKSKSKLVQALEMKEYSDLEPYTKEKAPKVGFALDRVVFGGWTYKKAGEFIGATKCAIYEHLIDIYKHKFGVAYADRNKNRN